jgi:hypothetical protein
LRDSIIYLWYVENVPGTIQCMWWSYVSTKIVENLLALTIVQK